MNFCNSCGSPGDVQLDELCSVFNRGRRYFECNPSCSGRKIRDRIRALYPPETVCLFPPPVAEAFDFETSSLYPREDVLDHTVLPLLHLLQQVAWPPLPCLRCEGLFLSCEPIDNHVKFSLRAVGLKIDVPDFITIIDDVTWTWTKYGEEEDRPVHYRGIALSCNYERLWISSKREYISLNPSLTYEPS
jgi:hypothetical protein